ncbi:hypothetical protein [Paenarthrobacter sp. Y-19]|uniref:hypothetical protein n=1 Tax=Paenarthrobacter sp. Y-19 TaxID=3031125 RepID=UPI001E799FE9|nr:hypothetical protein [Paenarthrobacter sp. Y-19]BCW12423.1 hypothetical protein NtRootA2_37050 [Arthrobacter sp. NtRootA2]BCW16506.1 hypothetical protein NtRootA4_34850 [Arthrobacter sp. NtRootA4]BCW24839.1 hypothetical protein NtRootC7_37060 [Arthrobacter sp. NtRootC7]BCW29108.1 hypothetical protein NtRootC45_37080 [Arthrobacter sp. NtRootC45]BCW33378.1 hypothetical protein NtRootD5_37090 [Arthrobacter sp. NtRootD5]
MEDPTTLAINLTYLGTLGLALLMFLGLGLIVIITLVVAGVGRLVSVILLALIGVFPKKDTTPIVHLPARPGYVPDPVVGADAVDGAAEESAPVAAPVVAAPSPAAAPAAPKRDLLGVTRRRISGASAAVKDGAWKSKVDPRKLPKPAEVKSAVEHQTAHHPIVVAAAKEPPVLSKDWADAVAEADRREAERAKAQQPPPIKVTVRDLDEPTPSSKSPAPVNPPKKQGPVTSPKGKSQGPTKKGSLSGAARNS